MKRIVLLLTTLLAALWLASASYAQSKPFITKWKGEANKELKIPIFGTGYKLVIKKASDNTELKTEASLTITENENFYTYTPTEDGEILVEAGPEGVEYIRFVDETSKRGSAENLLTVEQFGTVAWKSMREAFSYCNNMQFASTVGTPDLSNVTNLSYMFYSCSSFNQDLSSWNVSNVTDMRGMFDGCRAFNQDLSSWNVSNVTDMGYMFYGCSAFNQDISSWNVSNVTNMKSMFYCCSLFNQDLSGWKVDKVTNMTEMFGGCAEFNQNIGSWKLKACTCLGLEYCGMSVENYSKSLEGWAAQPDIKENLLLKADNLRFNEIGKNARTKLMNEKHWGILGDASEGGKVYDLKIGGRQLSSENINSFQEVLIEAGVLKKGKVSVTLEGEKLVLKLENAELTAPYDGFPASVLACESDEITIQLQGVCTITQLSEKAAIDVSKGIILGRNADDKLLVKGGDVYFSKIIRNCTVEIEKGLEGNDRRYLEIDNAVVKAKFIKHADLTLKNCSILEPEGARYDASKEEVIDKEGNTAQDVVVGTNSSITGIILSQHELTLVIGQTATLTAEVTPSDAPNKNYSWKSDNEAIAKVEDGLVTAVSNGETVIRVTTEVGNRIDECKVIVSEDGSFVPVIGIELSATNLPLKQGTSHTLVATVKPSNATNKAVTWSSDNDAVASVSNKGVVEAKTVGNATITVTTEDGGHTATCEVSVTAEDVVLTGITISPSETTLEVDKETTLSLTFVPITATHKGVKWSSSDPKIATVDEQGKVKGIAAGEATIIAVSEKYESVTNTCKVTVILPTAVEDAVFANVIVSPNPFDTQLRISNGDVRGKYALYNTLGVEVAFGGLEGAETHISTTSLPTGMYLLRLTTENGATKTFTVMKK